MKAIEVNGLARNFGQLVAVNRISFEVQEGEVFGFHGANGAGKTATAVMLATALSPTSGSVMVWGYDIAREKDRVRESISVVMEVD